MPGFNAEYIPGTLEKRRKQVILNLNVDEWEEFSELCAQRWGISRSEAVRRLVRQINEKYGDN